MIVCNEKKIFNNNIKKTFSNLFNKINLTKMKFSVLLMYAYKVIKLDQYKGLILTAVTVLKQLNLF